MGRRKAHKPKRVKVGPNITAPEMRWTPTDVLDGNIREAAADPVTPDEIAAHFIDADEETLRRLDEMMAGPNEEKNHRLEELGFVVRDPGAITGYRLTALGEARVRAFLRKPPEEWPDPIMRRGEHDAEPD